MTLDGLPPFVADSLRAALDAGRRWYVAAVRGVRAPHGMRIYVALHPECREAVLRQKHAAGLAEWRSRGWAMFGSRTPIIADVTDQVLALSGGGRRRLGVRMREGRVDVCDLGTNPPGTWIPVRDNIGDDWYDDLHRGPTHQGILRSKDKGGYAAWHQRPWEFWCCRYTPEIHDVTEDIPGVWRELLSPPPTAPRGMLGGATSRLCFHWSDWSVLVHRRPCFAPSQCVDVSSVSPLELLGGCATIQLHADDWLPFALSLDTWERAPRDAGGLRATTSPGVTPVSETIMWASPSVVSRN